MASISAKGYTVGGVATVDSSVVEKSRDGDVVAPAALGLQTDGRVAKNDNRLRDVYREEVVKARADDTKRVAVSILPTNCWCLLLLELGTVLVVGIVCFTPLSFGPSVTSRV